MRTWGGVGAAKLSGLSPVYGVVTYSIIMPSQLDGKSIPLLML